MALRYTLWIVVAALIVGGARASLQGEAAPRIVDAGGTDDTDVHEEINRLVGEIERGMFALDGMLWRASERGAERAPLTRLDEARARARKTVADIDRLLELANHEHEKGGT